MKTTREELIRQRTLIQEQLRWIEHKLAALELSGGEDVAAPPTPESDFLEEEQANPELEAGPSKIDPPLPSADPLMSALDPEQVMPTVQAPREHSAASSPSTIKPSGVDTGLPTGIEQPKLHPNRQQPTGAGDYIGSPDTGISGGQKLGCFIATIIICAGILALLFVLPQFLY